MKHNALRRAPHTQPSQPQEPSVDLPPIDLGATSHDIGSKQRYRALWECRERQLRESVAEVSSLRTQLADAKAGWDSAIADLRTAAGICKQAEADAECKGWNDAIEAAARKAESGQTPLGPKRIRALSREPGVSRTPKGENQ